MSDLWAAAPPGWMALDALPEAVARAVGGDAGAVAAMLRPLLETNALRCRWSSGSPHSRSIRVTQGGITYGAVDHNGNPAPPDWARVFSDASLMRCQIEVDFAAACAAVRDGSPVRTPKPCRASSAILPRPRGRSFRGADGPLVVEMAGMIEGGQARNLTDAARLVAARAVGDGTDESKVKRLVSLAGKQSNQTE